MEQEIAHRPQDVDDDVLLADRGTTRDRDEIVGDRFLHRGSEGLEAIRPAPQEEGPPAVLSDDARHRVRVDVVYLARADRLAGRHDLVAGREDRYARLRVHGGPGHAGGREGTDFRGREDLPFADDEGSAGEVFAAGRNAFPPGGRGGG